MGSEQTPSFRWPDAVARTSARWRLYVMVFVPLAVVLVALAVVGLTGVANIRDLMRDPLAVAGASAWCGCISNLGILVWCATASVCFFTASLLSNSEASERRRFFITAGAVTFVLLLDDLFMVHEKVLEGRVPHGEHLIMLAYLVMVAAFVLRYRTVLLRTGDLFLVATCLAFSVSILADIMSERVAVPMIHLWEDGAKLVGIVSWGAFLTFLARDEVTRAPRSPTARDKM